MFFNRRFEIPSPKLQNLKSVAVSQERKTSPQSSKRNHGVKCNTKQWIWFLSETAERDAINHVYQQEYGGFNELMFKNFGGFVVEIKVFTLWPCNIWKYFLQNHFMFNDRHDALSISNSRTSPSVNRFLMLFDIDSAWVKRGEQRSADEFTIPMETTAAPAWKSCHGGCNDKKLIFL